MKIEIDTEKYKLIIPDGELSLSPHKFSDEPFFEIRIEAKPDSDSKCIYLHNKDIADRFMCDMREGCPHCKGGSE